MTTLDFTLRRALPLPAMRQLRARLALLRDVAIGALLLLVFLVVAFAAFYLRARMGLPH